MVLDEFTGVVYSSGLTEPETVEVEPVLTECPRESLSLGCIRDSYVCLCEVVSGCTTTVQRNNNGVPVSVRLKMTVAPTQQNGAESVIAGVNLTGFAADIAASSREVTATFQLKKNPDLKTFVLESGL
jgi:hypothetical protein